MRKYYFARHSVNGLIFAFMWAEDDGICVGGRPKILAGTNPVEISEEDFSGDLRILSERYPNKEMFEQSDAVDTY